MAGDTLDADPSSIRGFAENASTMASNFQGDLEPARMITGDGETFSDTFAPGVAAQTAADEVAGEMLDALMACHTNLLAISMASYTCADVLGSSDNLSALDLNAVEYAFADPGATTPGGLPGYLDGTTLSEQLGDTSAVSGQETLVGTQTVRTADGTAVVHTYRTPDGGYRVVTKNSDGSIGTHFTDGDGNRIFEMTTDENGHTTGTQWNPDGSLRSETVTGADGRTVITSYHPGTGEVTGRTEQYRGHVGGPTFGYSEERTVTETYDAEGNRTGYTVQADRTYDDGTRQLGTVDEDGTFTPERTFTPEPGEPYPHGTPMDTTFNLAEQVQEDIERELGAN